MTIGRTDDPENPLCASACEAERMFGTGSRTPSGPAVAMPHQQAGHMIAIEPPVSIAFALDPKGPSTHAQRVRAEGRPFVHSFRILRGLCVEQRGLSPGSTQPMCFPRHAEPPHGAGPREPTGNAIRAFRIGAIFWSGGQPWRCTITRSSLILRMTRACPATITMSGRIAAFTRSG